MLIKKSKLTVKGLNQFIRHLKRLSSERKVRTLVNPAMVWWTEEMVRFLKNKPYPAELPNQKYKRTGLLSASFTTTQEKLGRHLMNNEAPGRTWAIGQPQARVHKGRWWTMLDELKKNTDLLEQRIAAVIENSFSGGQVE